MKGARVQRCGARVLFSYRISLHLTLPRDMRKNQNALRYLQGVAISKHFSHPSVQLLLSQIPGNDKKQTLLSPFSTSRSFSHSATQPLTQVRHWVKDEPVQCCFTQGEISSLHKLSQVQLLELGAGGGGVRISGALSQHKGA